MTKFKVKKDLRQLKLVGGDEIVCEVIEEHKTHFLVRNVLKITAKENQGSKKYFTFTPYMVYQEGMLQVIMLMTTHMMAFAIPTQEMAVQYNIALKEIDRIIQEDEKEMENIEEVVEEYFKDFVKPVTKKTTLH